MQVAVLGQGKPGAKLKLLMQALTSPSFAGREAGQPGELIPEDLQVRTWLSQTSRSWQYS